MAPEELDPGGGVGVDDEDVGGNDICPLDRSSRKKVSSSSGGDTTAEPTTLGAKRDRTILSRRQRKNRTRTPREVAPGIGTTLSSSGGDTSSSSPSSTPPGTRRNRTIGTNNVSTKSRKSRTSGARDRHGASKLHGKLNLSDAALAVLMHRYVLRGDQLVAMGYPVEGAFCPGRAIIFKDGFNFRAPPNLDANAQEFVPGDGKTYSEIADSWTSERADRSERSGDSGHCSGDSGHCSGSSLESSDIEPESSDCSDKASDIADNGSSSGSSSLSSLDVGGLERTCSRCYRGFNVSSETGEYISKERCSYHWGKFHDREWGCCGASESTGGCSTAKLHVWTGLSPGINGPLEGYVRTKPRKSPPPDGCYGIYALDCEMCFTRNGLELAKVTVVGIDGRLVYDTLVRPEAEVIDYNTRFSGITAKDIARSPKSLRDVQSDIMGFVNADTVLIGHGLENDLRALRLLHSNCVDTVVAFPHYLGLPYRRSLKSLARALLRRDIQNGQHDSLEDARTAAELMLWRIRRDIS